MYTRVSVRVSYRVGGWEVTEALRFSFPKTASSQKFENYDLIITSTANLYLHSLSPTFHPRVCNLKKNKEKSLEGFCMRYSGTVTSLGSFGSVYPVNHLNLASCSPPHTSSFSTYDNIVPIISHAKPFQAFFPVLSKAVKQKA